MWVDELIADENAELLFRITELTNKGKTDWECVEYNPISFLDKDRVDGNPARLSQIFDMKTEIGGFSYTLSITETITIPDGKGNLGFTLRRADPGHFMEIEHYLSRHGYEYEDCPPEKLAEVFADTPEVKMVNLIVPMVASNEKVQDSFSWGRFFNEDGISKKLRNDPLTKLGNKLFEAEDALSFHHAVLDLDYRTQIMSE